MTVTGALRRPVDVRSGPPDNPSSSVPAIEATTADDSRSILGYILVSGILTATWLAIGPRLAAPPRVVLLVAALAAHACTVLAIPRRRVGRHAVLITGIALLALAVAIPPQRSQDLWAYAMQGRIVSIHHANPYFHRPSDYPTDPALRRMAHGWRTNPNPYGPLFAAAEAGGTWLAGGSALATRLFFQGLAALAVMAIALALRRRPGGTAAAAFIILNPAVVVTVNGGHNDVLVGAAMLGAALLVDRRRLATAGACVAAAALIKVTALVAVPAILVWVIRRGIAREGARFLASTVAVFAVGYAAVGGLGALGPVANSANSASRAALLRWPRQVLLHDLTSGHLEHPAAVAAAGHVMTLATLCAVGVALLLVWRRGNRPASSAAAIVPAFVALILTMIYVLPWYALWVLPTAATRLGARSTLAAWVLAAALLLAYNDPPGVRTGTGLVSAPGHVALPIAALVIIGIVVAGPVRARVGARAVRG